LVAGFVLAALGMVLTALVAMYWKDPAFLTLSGEQALDLRKFEALSGNLPPEIAMTFLREGASTYAHVGQELVSGEIRDEVEEDREAVESELIDLLRTQSASEESDDNLSQES
jgi:hypothetical protein